MINMLQTLRIMVAGIIILMAIGAYVLKDSPILVSVLSKLGDVGNALLSNMQWMASNLEILLPFAVFLILFEPLPMRIAIAGGVAFALSLVLMFGFGL